MDFETKPITMQPGQSGSAAQPSPEQLMQKIALMRSLQGQQPQQAPQAPPMQAPGGMKPM